MPDWDEDCPQLRQNLARLLEEIVHVADRRDVPTVESARQWQSRTMEALDVPDARYVGRFRGEPGLEHVQVRVGPLDGVPAADVKEALARFEQKLQTAVAELDDRLPSGREPNADELDDIESGTLVKLRVQSIGENEYKKMPATLFAKAVNDAVKSDLQSLKKHLENGHG